MKLGKEPTWTKLVLDALRGCDDFMSRAMLERETGGAKGQVNSACHWLRACHAIDCIIEKDGIAWRYALAPEGDTRIKMIDRRKPEVNPRRRRKVAKRLIEAEQAVLRG